MIFLVIWVVVILLFSCVTILAFSQNPNFRDFEPTLNYFIRAAIGKYDQSKLVMEPPDAELFGGNPEEVQANAEVMTVVQQYLVLIYVLLNTVILLKFVVAILASTFGRYSAKQQGLFNEIIV